MDNPVYNYSPILDRPPFKLPNNARVAFYVGVNIEHYEIDKPSMSITPATAHLVPDALNYGWRDYGPRVGVWRMIEALDKVKMRASVLLNSDACERYPQIIKAGLERDWTWIAHGKNNSILQTGMTADEERSYLEDVVSTITKATGKAVKGWMGPALSETFETASIIRDLGLSYVLDWCADDQPFLLNVDGVVSVPYSVEINDGIMFVGKALPGEQFYQMVVDQFDQLYKEGKDSARVMALCLHPFIINQPFRQKYLEKALEYIAGHDGVWLTTSDDIAEHYINTVKHR
ncbi:polysaccharide deacetylase (plasmid) [Aminobacter sp. Y103A]|jgi:allantoinase|uniref:Chitooligosaccharide deacetylase n=1 Tax=Aminobacter aminovorans TaxID=83263 RepID=A0AAC8YWD0_AMIAI|nr:MULTISPECIES: polysaccharide deacetylase family protein [Aminobacter]AMS45274.1 polysaccharide deacetylase [Aminobacter aminovorans]MBB3704961.1 peptidoglycan/xylan/chitin deacetylase (PgdA/CDA1 family) [Aminobacter aminovorans]BBD41246.1 polysaccharide deacetylase [Aminobacter sp. SS-2016]